LWFVSLLPPPETWSRGLPDAVMQSTGPCVSHKIVRFPHLLKRFSHVQSRCFWFRPCRLILVRSIPMADHGISRRQLADFGLGMAAMAGFTSLPGIHTVP